MHAFDVYAYHLIGTLIAVIFFTRHEYFNLADTVKLNIQMKRNVHKKTTFRAKNRRRLSTLIGIH